MLTCNFFNSFEDVQFHWVQRRRVCELITTKKRKERIIVSLATDLIEEPPLPLPQPQLRNTYPKNVTFKNIISPLIVVQFLK